MSMSLVVALTLLVPSPSPTRADLNGDGIVDKIRFEASGDSYTVVVNDAVHRGFGFGLEGTFSLVDVDTSDRHMEVAIPEQGPSDDYETTFLRYEGKSIELVGKLPGTYDIQIDGSGRVRTVARGQVLQTWYYPCVFFLDSTSHFRRLRQELYSMRTACTMIFSLPLLASREDSAVVCVLQPGDRVTIEASDDSVWCLVRAPNDVWGWFSLTGYDRVKPLGVSASEVFEGLSYAD